MSSHQIAQGSDGCSIAGSYTIINLSIVGGLTVSNGEARVSGTLPHWLWGEAHFDPDNPPETGFVAARVPDSWGVLDSDVTTDWSVVRTVHTNDSTLFTLEGVRAAQSVTLGLPRGQGDLFFRAFRLDSHSVGFVVAGGNWKVGPQSYVGFLRVACPPPT